MSQPFPHLPTEAWESFLAGELADAAALRLDAHLETCAECRAVLEAEDSSFLFRRVRGLAAPPEVWDGFWEELKPQLSPVRRAPQRHLALLATAATLLLGTLVVMVPRWEPRHPGTLPGTRTPTPTPTVAEQPCPASAAQLHLTREECLALFSGPIVAPGPPELVVADTVDLRGL